MTDPITPLRLRYIGPDIHAPWAHTSLLHGEEVVEDDKHPKPATGLRHVRGGDGNVYTATEDQIETFTPAVPTTVDGKIAHVREALEGYARKHSAEGKTVRALRNTDLALMLRSAADDHDAVVAERDELRAWKQQRVADEARAMCREGALEDIADELERGRAFVAGVCANGCTDAGGTPNAVVPGSRYCRSC